MYRIWTWLTLNAAGEPTNAGTWFIPDLFDLDANLGRNKIVQPLQDGRELLLNNTKVVFPVNGLMTIPLIHVDLQSRTEYDGGERYLGPTFRNHHVLDLPICIFHRNIQQQHLKCYICEIMPPFPPKIEAQTTGITDKPMNMEGFNLPRSFTFRLQILLHGSFTDMTDVTSGTWVSRT